MSNRENSGSIDGEDAGYIDGEDTRLIKDSVRVQISQGKLIPALDYMTVACIQRIPAGPERNNVIKEAMVLRGKGDKLTPEELTAWVKNLELPELS